MSLDGLKFFPPNQRHYTGNHCDYTSLGAVWWCWLYYFVKAGQGYVEKEGEKCRSGRFLSMHVVKSSHQHRRPLWQCCSFAENSPESTSKSKVFDNIYFILDVEFLAVARRNKEMQFHLSETLFLAVTAATVYRYTNTFGVLAETSKCVAVIAFSLNS